MDGSSYLYRAFHALPDLRTSKGEPTGALRGVLSMLRRLVIDDKPDYFAVVFDAPGKTFRDDWYADYKANRKAMPDDLTAQISPLHDLVRAHGWPLLMIEGVEADDVIGTLSREAQAAGIDTVISTSDKDLAQLVAPGITLVNTMSNERLDEQGVVAKFGVRPEQFLDLLTLTGDAIDNVPGVAKVGPKTAAKWLAQYQTLDNLMTRAGEVGGVVGENLRNAREWLPQGKRLLTVRIDCEIGTRVADLTPGHPDLDRLRELYERFEFKGWLRDLGRPDVNVEIAPRPPGSTAEAGGERNAVPPPGPPPEYETLHTDDALARWLDRLASAGIASLDVETTGSDPMNAQIVGIALATDAGCAAYIPARPPLCGSPRATRPRRGARTSASMAWRCDTRQARSRDQVRRACARESRRRPARRHRRHAARVVRHRVAPAARPRQSRLASPRSADDRLRCGNRQGNPPHSLRAGGDRACDRIRGGAQ